MYTRQTEYLYALGYRRDFGKTGTWGYNRNFSLSPVVTASKK